MTSSTLPLLPQFDHLLRESSWLDKMQGITAHLKCWNCWKGEMQSWYRNPSWHRRSILRRIWNLGFSTRVNFSTAADFSVSMQIWKVTVSILQFYCSMFFRGLGSSGFWHLPPKPRKPIQQFLRPRPRCIDLEIWISITGFWVTRLLGKCWKLSGAQVCSPRLWAL